MRTVSRVLQRAGLNRRKFIDPAGEVTRQPQRPLARWPGHMVHVDVKKVGQIPRWRRGTAAQGGGISSVALNRVAGKDVPHAQALPPRVPRRRRARRS